MSSVFARSALASFIALHGIAHLAGTADLFSRAADGRAVDLLIGSTSDPLTLRMLGVAWAGLAVAFAIVAAVMWAGRPRWALGLGWTTLASLALLIVALWASAFGVVIDLALLAVVAIVLTRSRQTASVAG